MRIYPYQFPSEHTAVDRTPYTYHIAWSELDVHYYGSRYGKKCHPVDLWNPYKTSSKYVKSFIEEHGDPDTIEVRKIFDDVKKCREYERNILFKLKVIYRDNWLNKHDQKTSIRKDGYDCYIDANGHIIFTSKNDLRISTGSLTHVNKGKAVYKDSNGNTLKCKPDDPRVLSGELVGVKKGTKTFINENLNKITCDINNSIISEMNLMPLNSCKTFYKDNKGNSLFCRNDDPRVLSGELVGIQKGKATYRDSEGNYYNLQIDDPKIINDNLVHINKGREQSEDHKLKNKEAITGLFYWNNGIENKRSKECPGEGWVRGMQTNRKWWNNHTNETLSIECPGEGWVRGRLPKS